MNKMLLTTYVASGVKWWIVLAYGFPLWVAVGLSILSKLGLLAVARWRRTHGRAKRHERRTFTPVVRTLWAFYWGALLGMTATDPSGQDLGGIAVWAFLIAGGAFLIGSLSWLFDHHFEVKRRPVEST